MNHTSNTLIKSFPDNLSLLDTTKSETAYACIMSYVKAVIHAKGSEAKQSQQHTGTAINMNLFQTRFRPNPSWFSRTRDEGARG
jgi:hypothetical protein